MIMKLFRRWRARNWRCRCGRKVFDKTALLPSYTAPKQPRCGWHSSVREQVLSGKITDSKSAR